MSAMLAIGSLVIDLIGLLLCAVGGFLVVAAALASMAVTLSKPQQKADSAIGAFGGFILLCGLFLIMGV